MNPFSRLTLVTGLLALAAIPFAQAQEAPYLETRSLTIHWNFTLTGVSGTTIGKRPLPMDTAGNILGIDDPDRLNPNDRITSERGILITYTRGEDQLSNGEQDFIVEHLLRNVIESGGQGLSELELSGRWELTAVREPQTSVQGAATADYQIFLTRIDPTRTGGRISRTYFTDGLDVITVDTADPFSFVPVEDEGDPEAEPEFELVFNPRTIATGLYLRFGRPIGSYNETLSDGRVTRASGNISVPYTLSFNSVYAEDPFYLATGEAELGKDYHSQPAHWHAFGIGVMSAGLRATPGGAVVPTNMRMTATGYWSHIGLDYSGLPDEPATYFAVGGIAPLRLKLGEPKFQHRGLFPTLGGNAP